MLVFSGCVTEDDGRKDHLIDHYRKQQDLKQAIESHLRDRTSIVEAEVTFGEDPTTGAEQIAVILEPETALFTPQERAAVIEQVAELSGVPSSGIRVLLSR